MPNLNDITERIAEALKIGARRSLDPTAHLTGTRSTPAGPVGGVWRGQLVSDSLEMEVLVTLRNTPRPGTATWHATGVSQQAWETKEYETNLGPVVVKSHSFNPQGHYYELEGFGEVSQLSAAEVH